MAPYIKPESDDLIDFFFAILIVIVVLVGFSYFYGWILGWMIWLFVTNLFQIKLKSQIAVNDFVLVARWFFVLFFFLILIAAVVKVRQCKSRK